MMENPTLGVQSMDQEKDEQREYPEAYDPIPKGVIKEEDTSGENNVEQQMMYPFAYPPLPRGLVKEEELFGDAQEECNGQAQQLMASSPTSNGTINKELELSKEGHNAINLDEGKQVSLEPLIAYPSFPRGAIKEEPLEEKGDEQPKQVIVSYQPITKGRIKRESQSDANQDEFNVEEHQFDLEPLVAYPSLLRGVIKEEPVEEREGEEPAIQLISYPPISRGKVKEEAVDYRDDFNQEKQQLIPQEEGNQNLVDESTSALITYTTADVSTSDRGNGNGTKRRMSQRRKKIDTASTAVVSASTGSNDQSAKLMPTTNSRTRLSLHQLKRGSTSMVSADNDGEKNDHSTSDRGNGAQRPKSKKRKIAASTANTPSSTGSGDQSSKMMSTISSRTRRISMHQLKQGKKSMTKDADEENDDHIAAESDDFGGHNSGNMAPTFSSQTLSHHLKPGSSTVARAAIGETSKKRKVNEDNSIKEKQQQGEYSSLMDGDSSSFSVETSERPSDSHNKNSCKECGRGFQKKCSLRLHFLKTHTEKAGHETLPLNRFKCDQSALRVRPVLPYKCEKCEKTSKSKDALYVHKKRVCGVTPSFFCVKCDYRTARKFDLRKHLMDVHDIEPSQLANCGAGKVVRPQLPFKCDKCERSYKHKHHLKHHMDFECGKIPSFPCNQCGYRASRNGNLKRHIDAVHGSSSSSLQA